MRGNAVIALTHCFVARRSLCAFRSNVLTEPPHRCSSVLEVKADNYVCKRVISMRSDLTNKLRLLDEPRADLPDIKGLASTKKKHPVQISGPDKYSPEGIIEAFWYH